MFLFREIFPTFQKDVWRAHSALCFSPVAILITFARFTGKYEIGQDAVGCKERIGTGIF